MVMGDDFLSPDSGVAVTPGYGGITGPAVPPTALDNVFYDSLVEVKTNVTSYTEIALPIALGVAGVFVAIRLGLRFFRNVTN